ncbi:uncharacterized protein LOC123918130 isoform X3 [Trifolium pratense]|uniref:uncharacterized protein LOC123918130 isoform X3 n=2 Tax=Trifolium pratense TaxID=57577 RepID=UPI001E691C45|nr:uncharacterized protein LOC123918130 isoform X3 [Trifolium pratense]
MIDLFLLNFRFCFFRFVSIFFYDNNLICKNTSMIITSSKFPSNSICKNTKTYGRRKKMTEIQGFGGNKATYGRTEEDFGVFRKKEPMSGHEVVLKMIHMLTSISVQLNWTLFELKGNKNVLVEFHSGFMNNRERNGSTNRT